MARKKAVGSGGPESFGGSDGVKTVVYDKAFVFGRTLSSARDYFESGRDKSLLGFGRPLESVDSIKPRFTPLGVFRLGRAENITGSGGLHDRVVEKDGVFYVGLSSLELFYVDEGVLGRKPSLRSDGFLSKAAGLSDESLKLFSQVLAAGRLSFSELSEELKMFVSRSMKPAYALSSRSLIDVRGGRDFVFTSRVSIPEFGNRRFSLSSYFKSVSPLKTTYPADGIKYGSDAVSELLCRVFSAKVLFDCVVYLPYYLCRFVDGGGGYRLERLLSADFKV